MAIDAGLAGLADERAALGRTSTAERVADILRTRITEGLFLPGARLSEDEIGRRLDVSRNTLREAFRLLTHERLLTHRLNRGVFVRVLTVEDVTDLYRVRTVIECGVVRGLAGLPEPPPLDALTAAVAEGEKAYEEGEWRDLGTANMHFHQALAALAGSPRADELMRGLLAELRLVFHVMADPRRFHEPYLADNRAILGRLAEADVPGTERLLTDYLRKAERQLAEAYAQRITEDRTLGRGVR